MSLDGLSAARLLELGGLKHRCSAPLRCVAHGLAFPCEVCSLEGAIGVSCKACGHCFTQGLLESHDRPCQSEAVFLSSGKIAFEDEAMAANQAEAKNSGQVQKLCMNLPDIPVEIRGLHAEGPTQEGEYDIVVKARVKNEGQKDWELVEVRVQLLNADFTFISEEHTNFEETVGPGEWYDLQTNFWGVHAESLGDEPTRAHVLITVVACEMVQADLGVHKVPEHPHQLIALKPTQLGKSLQMLNGSITRSEPYEDLDCLIEFNTLVQNLTSHRFPEVRLDARLRDKHGRELEDIGCVAQVDPGSIVAIGYLGYVKANKLKAAEVSCTIRAFLPVGAGLGQSQGMKVIPD